MPSDNHTIAEPCIKKRFSEFSRYVFPDTSFTVFQSLKKAGNMGRSVDDETRKHLYRFADTRADRVYSLRQIHSKRIITVDDWHDGVEADGIICTDGSRTLGITSADCLPVFIFHPQRPCFGGFHSGWKGTGIVSNGIKRLGEVSGCGAEEFVAFIGPGIGSCCYNVDDERGSFFRREYGVDAAYEREGEWFLDLRAANVSLLTSAGISRIFVDDDCTVCNTAYGSFRREGAADYTLMLSLGRYITS